MGAVGVGYLGTLLAYLYLTYTSPSYNKDGKKLTAMTEISLYVSLVNCSYRGIHSCGIGVRIPRRVTDSQRDSEPPEKWSRYTICCNGVGSSCSVQRLLGFVPKNASCLPWGSICSLTRLSLMYMFGKHYTDFVYVHVYVVRCLCDGELLHLFCLVSIASLICCFRMERSTQTKMELPN